MKQRELQLMDALPVAVLVMRESDGQVLYANPVVRKDLSRQSGQITGHPYRQVFTPDFSALYERIQRECADGEERSYVFYWKEKRLWEQILGKRICWEEDHPAIMLTITNITEVSRAMLTYQKLAYFDNLLEIPNGAKLEEDISALGDPQKVALLYMEIDHFDHINDLYGFDVGDALLRQVRDWLLESESRDSQVYRVTNGFAILGYVVTPQDGEARASQICKRFEEPWTVGGLEGSSVLYCHVNVGVVFGKYVQNEMRNLLMRTVRAPKNARGFAVYDEEIDAAFRSHLLLRQTLNNCVQQGMTGFAVHYQPIVEGVSHRWIGAEALCRWTTPGGENVPPLTFIRIAEQMGLIDAIDNWVRETAMTQCMAWGLHEKDFMLDVNFSPRQKIDRAFLENLVSVLEATGYPAPSLTMEITESTKMPFTHDDMQGLQWMREKGISLSLDDFGTGYSSIENLIKIPGSFIKIERMFLDQLESDSFRQYLLNVVIGVAAQVDMKIVSEGVETEDQCRLLERFGVDYMQGFLFSRPLSREQFAREIHRFGERPGVGAFPVS